MAHTDPLPDESLSDYIERANDNCCGCGWAETAAEMARRQESLIDNLQHVQLRPVLLGPGGEVGVDIGMKVTNDLGVNAEFVGFSWVPYLEPVEEI